MSQAETEIFFYSELCQLFPTYHSITTHLSFGPSFLSANHEGQVT